MFPNDHLYNTFSRVDLQFDSGNDAWLKTDDNELYLDFGSGVAVNSLGHAHPHLVETLKQQAEKLWHTSNLFEIPGQRVLAQRLCALSFADKVFFTNSGGEANECAIKTARRYHYERKHPERYEIITFEGAFHGRTLATLAAGGQEKYLEGFGPKVAGFKQVPFNDRSALRSAIGPQTAAIMIEPIQGEQGVRVASVDLLRDCRKLCDEFGLLLIFDEVQTGIARTGKFFAYEWFGVAPDILTIAKGIGGGFPLGACLATQNAARAMTPGSHGTTFGGNPLAMAVGNAVLDVILADGFIDHVNHVADRLHHGLDHLTKKYNSIVSAVSGIGLLLGLKCAVANTDLIAACRREHLLAVAAGSNVMRILPPLTIEDDLVDEGLRRLETAIKTFAV